MRAHNQRRLLWILNVVLVLALLGLAAWYVFDVKAKVADAAHLKPAWAEAALRGYEEEPPASQSALKVPVAEAELDEIDQKRFQQNGRRWWWLYSGPLPPTPPEEETVETVKRPTVSALEKLGKVLFLIYWPPEPGEEIARESVLSWAFSDDDIEEFKPGEPIRKTKEAPWSIRLVNIKRAPGGGYEIIYEVFDELSDDPVEPKGESQGLSSLFWGAKPQVPKDLEGVVRIVPKRPPPSADGEGGASEDASGEDPAAPAAGTVGVTEAPEAPAPAAEEEVKATIEWENRSRANVSFDQRAYDYFKGRDVESIAKTVKTQVAKDRDGNVIGLAITGLDGESPAMKFDVRPGDILVSIDGQPVASRSDAINIVQGMDPDVSRVTVVIDRNGRLITYVIDPQDPETRRAARYLEEER